MGNSSVRMICYVVKISSNSGSDDDGDDNGDDSGVGGSDMELNASKLPTPTIPHIETPMQCTVRPSMHYFHPPHHHKIKPSDTFFFPMTEAEKSLPCYLMSEV